MRIIALLIMVLLLMGCKSKKVLKTSILETEKTQIISEKKENNSIEKEIQKQKTKKAEVSEQKKETATDIEVKGKAETDNPLEIYNIENGDTLQTIKVTGNAEVHVRAKASKSDQVKKENISESLLDKFKEFSEKLVKDNNVEERVHEAKGKSKQSFTRTGTFWSFGLIGGLGAFTLLLIVAFIYFKNYRKNEKD
ncbi:hypothetical protein LNP80_00270 [Chryseobacterium sp. C-39]|uniref:Lipoprotein n=2 Tax=Chryseobacterium muglaense TaxID=2893752 RepID=A0A9Q3UTE6_9FLAO|nr:hypothetical protein [Chryseobacterium muglaense]MBD3904491.1 hypothetical protein [Chryseobacterium muglaense]MCC9032690.1 hypothetical protein [Chryseobacterium muglaense]